MPLLSKEFAQAFADEWIAAWNSHDVERVLSHYCDDFEFSSPVIITVAGEVSGRLKGKTAVGAYWTKALQMIPHLHFELHHVLVGIDNLVILYQGHRGRVAEVFFFDGNSKVCRAHACYA